MSFSPKVLTMEEVLSQEQQSLTTTSLIVIATALSLSVAA